MLSQYIVLSAKAFDGLAGLSPWRRRLVAAGAGAVSVLAFAPFHVWPVLWLTLPALVWLGDIAENNDGHVSAPTSRWTFWQKSRAGRAAETGWWWGFGFFVVGLSWIGEAFLVEAEVFAWLLPFAVTLLPAGLALFMALAMASAALLAPAGPQRILALALTMSATEWLRGHILTGFPWNTLGYALTYPLPLMQWSAVVGIYGLTVITVLTFAAPVVVLRHAVATADADRARRLRCIAAAAALFPLAMLLTGGVWRTVAISTYDGREGREPRHTLRIVQPSVPQREKWRPENQRRIFDDHIALSLSKPDGRHDGAVGIGLIVWPEAAMPFRPLDSPAALAEIGRMLPKNTVLVSGALRIEATAGTDGGPRRVFNSLLAFGDGGQPIAVYDKTHLVPFGEYLPAQRLLESIGLQQLSKLRGGFAEGVNPRPLLTIPSIGGFAPLICYEAIFPDLHLANEARPRALLNVTNDGWFGNSIGPRQHFHQARVRAVEQGAPLIRAANNGISAVIDPYGRILHQLDLNVAGSIDSDLPATAPSPLYRQFGDSVFLLMLTAILAWLLLIRLRMRDQNHS